MDKKGGKPPLPPKPGYVADTLVFKVGGSWSTEFNEDLIQLALFKLRSDKPVAFSYKYNPSKKQNPLSDDAIASPSKKLKGGS